MENCAQMHHKTNGRSWLTGCLFASAVLLAVQPVQAGSRYFKERPFSPVTVAVADNLRAIIAAGALKGRHPGRFMKVGDSITASDKDDSHTAPNSQYLSQFVCPDWTSSSKAWDYVRRLDTYQAALSPVLLYFLADTLGDGTTSFNRSSVAAQVGWASDQAISGNPCPLRREIDSVSPQCAVIMYGANDAGGYGSLYSVLSHYLANMHAIVDTCLAQGIVPMLSSTCPRLDKMDVSLAMSHLVRCLAQQHQVPFIDYHRAMMPLPNHGMGGDGLHPVDLGYNQCCWFTAAGLLKGYNLRNLLTLQALDRMYKIMTTPIASLDPEPPALSGSGLQTDPFVVDSISFIDAQTTSSQKPEMYYRLDLNRPLRIRTMVVCQDGADIDISLLNGNSGVVASAASEPLIDQDLSSGTYYIKLATSGSKYGQYQFIILDRDNDGSPSQGSTGSSSASRTSMQPGMSVGVAQSIFMIALPSAGAVGIYTLQGKSVFSMNIPGASRFRREWELPSAGVFFVKFTSGGIIQCEKIIARQGTGIRISVR